MIRTPQENDFILKAFIVYKENSTIFAKKKPIINLYKSQNKSDMNATFAYAVASQNCMLPVLCI